jgi:C1A family cysteine protease
MKKLLLPQLYFALLFGANTALAEKETYDLTDVAHYEVGKLQPALRSAANAAYAVDDNWVTRYLKRGGDIKNITGAIPVSDEEVLAKSIEILPMADPPQAFSWRDVIPDGLQPIRNQSTCGSCWAFSVVATVEALLKINDPSSKPDLAEQTLVSTCTNAGNCSGGYFDAFNYIKKPGLPDEAQDPYVKRNTSCKQGLNPVASIVDWSYIRGPNNGSPTTAQLKAAIMKYGPISVTVNASFTSYKSGVYNNCNSSQINHMVNIEGWNDDGQYWIMRNSWGTAWGEKGYMRIKYVGSSGRKCNNIGQTAAFAVLKKT